MIAAHLSYLMTVATYSITITKHEIKRLRAVRYHAARVEPPTILAYVLRVTVTMVECHRCRMPGQFTIHTRFVFGSNELRKVQSAVGGSLTRGNH